MVDVLYYGIYICLYVSLLTLNTHGTDTAFKGSYNIAFNKSTHQSPYDWCKNCKQWPEWDNGQWREGYTCHNCFWSSLAVDGNTNPDTNRGSCSHTDSPYSGISASWSVDLDGLYYLSWINITNRYDASNCCRSRLKGFSIHGYPGHRPIYQNDDDSYLQDAIKVEVPDIYKNTKFSNITISVQAAHYAKSFLTLCEVQVFLDQALNCTVPDLEHGTIKPVSGFPAYNFLPIGGSLSGYVPIESIVQFSCEKGYILSKRGSFKTCGRYGTWMEPIPTCLVVKCNSPPSIMNGYWESMTGFCLGYNCSLRFMCNVGYRQSSAKSVNIYCRENGSWSYWNETCKAIVCIVPDNNASNALYETPTSVVNYNTTVLAMCREGHKLYSGNLSRICMEDGSLSGLEPKCTEIKCLHPNKTSGGTYTRVLDNGTEEILREYQAKQLLHSFNTTLRLYCNGGINSLRKYNEIRCLTDSTWSGPEPTCRGTSQSKFERSETSSTIIGGLVGAGVVLLIAIASGIFLLIRRKRLKSSGQDTSGICIWLTRKRDQLYSNVGISSTSIRQENLQEGMEYSTIEQRPETSTQDIETSYDKNIKSKRDTDEDKDLQNTYYNTSSFDKKSSTAIMLEDLADIVSFGKELEYTLEKQFKALPSGMTRSHKVALRSENSKKNRYKQIYAYDDTRVVLEYKVSKDDTDYINASYIHGFSMYREYIASQGPTKEMINDFWRMIWQVDSRKIIMLTKLIEEEKIKCIQYWPNEGSQQWGSITVSLVETEYFSNFIIRTLVIKNKLSGAERNIHQFHFTAWPDKGVPQYTSAIVHFQNKVKKLKTTESGPTIVHCSAGIGRTGTYIALDILTEQGKHEDYVDVASCVGALRRQRVNMVQTLDQYIFLHSALAEALMLSSSAVSTAKFAETYHDLFEVDPNKRKRNIEVAFDMLKHMSPVVDEQQYVSAKEVRNRKRNRYSNILPEYMPQIQGSSKDGYINAVFLPSYKERKALILTQMPLKNTKDDFWSLVEKHDVHTIVMLNTVNEAEHEEVYWPEESHSQVYGGIEVTTTNQERIGKCLVVTMELKNGNLVKTLKQIQCQFWKSSQKLPESCSDVIETIELVQRLQQQSGNHPIVVHCMNGVDRSGLFCVITAVIERLRVEQDVAITQVIEQMRCARDQIVPSVEQFQFCHEVILTYIQQFSEYSNFSTI